MVFWLSCLHLLYRVWSFDTVSKNLQVTMAFLEELIIIQHSNTEYRTMYTKPALFYMKHFFLLM